MKNLFLLPVLSLVVLASCTSDYKKAEKGVEYKIVASGSGKNLMNGNFIRIHVKQTYKSAEKDSTLIDSRDIMPRIEQFDSLNYPSPYYRIFREMRNGDSLVLRMLTDSAVKESGQPMPSFMKKGAYLYTTIKIMNVFTSSDQADSARTADMKIAEPLIYKKQLQEVKKVLDKNKTQLEADDRTISEYLAKNNIPAIKGEWGTYVFIHNDGTGEKIDHKSL
jgi:FKBP-type peptidyl-prolyl cis-trans isomerase FkpA